MKKIMFNDAFYLTQAVLDGRKKITRRIISEMIRQSPFASTGWEYVHSGKEFKPKYKIGEVVAIAQSYNSIIGFNPNHKLFSEKGYKNKMFVNAGLMPYQIKITKIRIQKLQDISDEDCLKEGIIEHSYSGYMVNGIVYKTKDEFNGSLEIFSSPQGAYAKLIDKISGKGTWESNPQVCAYEFELIKQK